MDEINSLTNNGKTERLNRVESIRNGQLLMCDTEDINVFVFIDLESLKGWHISFNGYFDSYEHKTIVNGQTKLNAP